MANTWEVQTTGHANNAGAVDSTVPGGPGGANDLAYANTPVIAEGGAISFTIDGTDNTKVVVSGRSVVAGDVGNYLLINGQTTLRRITNYNAGANTWTFGSAVGTVGASINGRVGGALPTPGRVLQLGATTGDDVFVKAGTYTFTTTSTNVAGGLLAFSGLGNDASAFMWIGYSGTRNGYWNKPASKPVFQLGAAMSSQVVFNATGSYQNVKFQWIDVDLNSNASAYGYLGQTHSFQAVGAKVYGGGTSSVGFKGLRVQDSWATGCGTGFDRCWGSGLVANANTGIGFANCYQLLYSLAAANGSHGCYWDSNSDNAVACNVTSDGNANDGFRAESYPRHLEIRNCLATKNGGLGFVVGSNAGTVDLLDCVIWSNTGGTYSHVDARSATRITLLTGSGPYTNRLGGDFSITNSGDGAVTRGVGAPGVLLYGGTGYVTPGALVPSASGGGGSLAGYSRGRVVN